ncbi:MAG: Hsp20/alpha crystallin family protein [Candidatus Binatus sp.]|uniref:Hsp20/alpha crystallin family protein n=1 Tax=Candidatus Binatus sp. TaxID=2811406 RepID=UPI00271D1B3A|nr:Hsp20/alpha crystallin family protein [Candidatus Binatus sp.]MDO8430850.1 Hsp20/alpha crystallin family protein [Candidatus Binatus sp.]
MTIRRGFGIEDFDKAFDEFFDELLIDRWKCGTRPNEFEHADVFDHEDSYQVRLAAAGIDPAQLQVEVLGQRLAVRVPVKLGGMLESSFSFTESIDGEASTAKYSEGTLTIILPKKKGRRISLKKS